MTMTQSGPEYDDDRSEHDYPEHQAEWDAEDAARDGRGDSSEDAFQFDDGDDIGELMFNVRCDSEEWRDMSNDRDACGDDEPEQLGMLHAKMAPADFAAFVQRLEVRTVREWATKQFKLEVAEFAKLEE